ncbi:hypothetical protein ES288_D10G112100v1 [Gossypium darwinii]|uniref:Uncharacterized protein n=1 Tax=Gossypium darwinii TaxID=34276 RepID=A0A5D2AYN8_GOSDA|nr:hypothetical protein ES288_D10G112100v1 [Gossypium darwinii]
MGYNEKPPQPTLISLPKHASSFFALYLIPLSLFQCMIQALSCLKVPTRPWNQIHVSVSMD